MSVSEPRKPDRLSLPHWQALLAAAVRDTEAAGAPSPVVLYLTASLLEAEASDWQAYGNGWSLRTGDAWRARAKEFLPPERDQSLRDAALVAAAQRLVTLEGRLQGAPVPLPTAQPLLDGWSAEYSRFGLMSAARDLANEVIGALQAWLSAALARKPWPSAATLQQLIEIGGTHARWLGSNPLTAVCFPFGAIVQAAGKAGQRPPPPVLETFAASLEALVLLESSERRRREQWVAKLRALATEASDSTQ